jgi:heterodisulfide reductase subunit A
MKQIAILGAGPAGIEAASLLASLGHPVTLYEKESEPLGNITDKAFLFPNFADAQEVAATMRSKLDNPNITLRCNTEVTQLLPSYIAGFQEENLTGTPVWKVNDELYDIVLLATGYTPFDAHRKEELGYGIYPGVHTSLEMEKMIREKRIINSVGDSPKRIVFLQCVGSRDEKSGNHYCSKLCCVTAVKQAIEAKKQLPDCEVYVFYMDLRMWGQGFEEMYRTAQQDYGVNFIRGRISEAGGTFDGRVQIKAEDTLLGRPMKMTSDLLVLMVGMEASKGTRELATQCRICGEYGFAQSKDPHLHDCQSDAPGLYVAGACKRPMTLSDSINDGRSAAYEILTSL